MFWRYYVWLRRGVTPGGRMPFLKPWCFVLPERCCWIMLPWFGLSFVVANFANCGLMYCRGSCVFWTQLWGWSKFTRNSYHPQRRCICRWCGGVREIRRDVVDLVPVQWRPHVGPLLGWNALTGEGEGGGREYHGGWEFGKWSLSSSLYLTHTHARTHPESGCAVNSSSSSLWRSSGRWWCWKAFGGPRRSSN